MLEVSCVVDSLASRLAIPQLDSWQIFEVAAKLVYVTVDRKRKKSKEVVGIKFSSGCQNSVVKKNYTKKCYPSKNQLLIK